MKKAVLVLLIVLLGSSLSVATGEAQRPQPGPVGGDLGGYYSQIRETPEPIHYNDSQLLIKSRRAVSPGMARGTGPRRGSNHGIRFIDESR